MKKIFYIGMLFLTIFILLFSTDIIADNYKFPKITINNGKLYAGGEELLLKTVGYAGLRPGKDHTDPFTYKEHGYKLMEMDMKRIKEAGFNAIRTWDLGDEKIIELAEKNGLWVVGGIWTSQKIQLSSNYFTRNSILTIKKRAKKYSKYSNIAMLLILNEPCPGVLLGQEEEKVKKYFNDIVEAAKEVCPGVPVSFSNWPNAAFIDTATWDIVSYNIYASSTTIFQKSIGFRGYISGIKNLDPNKKPFFISESTYYSPAPKKLPDDFTASHHVKNENEQSFKTIRDLNDLAQLDLAGFTIMQWMDNWSVSAIYPQLQHLIKNTSRNKYIHDDINEEWGGLLSLDKDVLGTPRKVYKDLSKINQAIVVKPNSEKLYSNKIPIKIYVEDKVKRAVLSIDNKKLGLLKRVSPHWIEKEISLKFPASPEIKKLIMKVDLYGEDNSFICAIKRNIWICSQNKIPVLEITTTKDKMNWPTFNIKLTDPNGKPVSKAKITWGILNALNWKQEEGHLITDDSGKVSFESPMHGPLLIVGAGYQYSENGFNKKCTDLIYFKNN